MQYLKNTPVSTLYWVQPRGREPEFELRSDDELFCTVRWSTCNQAAPVSVVSADGQWTIILQGWTVRIASFDGDIAVCKLRWFSSDTVEFFNGRKFDVRIDSWLRRWTFSSSEGTGTLLFLKVTRIIPLFKLKVRVDLTQRLKDLPEASLLVALGLYLLVYVWSPVIWL